MTDFFTDASCEREAGQPEEDVKAVMVRLLDAYTRLQAAAHRIGYLEGQLRRYQQSARVQESWNAEFRRGDRPVQLPVLSRPQATALVVHEEQAAARNDGGQGVRRGARWRQRATELDDIDPDSNYYSAIRKALGRLT